VTEWIGNFRPADLLHHLRSLRDRLNPVLFNWRCDPEILLTPDEHFGGEAWAPYERGRRGVIRINPSVLKGHGLRSHGDRLGMLRFCCDLLLHELIHCSLDQSGCRESCHHGHAFLQEATRVSQLLDQSELLPRWRDVLCLATVQQWPLTIRRAEYHRGVTGLGCGAA
jgi:hypothetical protein